MIFSESWARQWGKFLLTLPVRPAQGPPESRWGRVFHYQRQQGIGRIVRMGRSEGCDPAHPPGTVALGKQEGGRWLTRR